MIAIIMSNSMSAKPRHVFGRGMKEFRGRISSRSPENALAGGMIVS